MVGERGRVKGGKRGGRVLKEGKEGRKTGKG